jgi:cysteine-rich repeat protein
LISCAAFFAAPNAHALPGQVLGEQKISSTAGGFGGALDDQDQFGSSVTLVGDLDGNTVRDLIVGAARDGDGGVAAGAAWVLFMDASGMVVSEAKISATSGGLGGPLGAGDQFGMAVAGIGDLDGDTVPDVVVGADGDDDGGPDRGAVYVLLLNADGSVKAEQKIDSTTVGLGGSIGDGARFGSSITSLGDLDGDSVVDIAVGAPLADGQGSARGAVWILFLNADGTLKSTSLLDDSTGALGGSLSDLDLFGSSVAAFHDLDGDGHQDLAVGAPGDSDNGTARGAIWVLNLDVTGSIVGLQKINDGIGGFTATLDDDDAFGAATAVLPDVDGDGIADLAVGATGDDTGGFDRGNVYVLFMNQDGSVSGYRRINAPASGFVGPLVNTEMFGNAVTSIRDLDGDMIPDLAVGLRHSSDGGANRGAVYVVFLDGAVGTLCGDGFLDPAEECDDGNDDANDCCAPDCSFESVGTSCPDGDVCNGSETCDGAGTCLAAAPLDCSDGQACTQDSCDPVLGCFSVSGPAPDCRSSSKGSVLLVDKLKPASDKLNWKWLKGESAFEDFGDPMNTDTLALCVYDMLADVPDLVAGLVLAPSAANWSVLGANKGLKYKDPNAQQSGVKQVVMKAGPAGKAKITVKAKGPATPLPGAVIPEYFAQDSAVVLQLVGSHGECWGTEFVGPALKNEFERFKDKLF